MEIEPVDRETHDTWRWMHKDKFVAWFVETYIADANEARIEWVNRGRSDLVDKAITDTGDLVMKAYDTLGRCKNCKRYASPAEAGLKSQ